MWIFEKQTAVKMVNISRYWCLTGTIVFPYKEQTVKAPAVEISSISQFPDQKHGSLSVWMLWDFKSLNAAEGLLQDPSLLQL